MARSVVSKGGLLKVEGLAQIIGKLEKIIENTTGGTAGPKLKKIYFEAAAIHSNQVRANIANLNASADLKEVLTLAVVTNEGPENRPNAISAIVQGAAIRRLNDPDRFVPNPYWFEFGTVPRVNRKGANRGMIHPSPFFTPAIEQSRQRVIESLKNGLKKLLES